MKIIKKTIFISLLILSLSACNFPGQAHEIKISASDLVLTAAVQTVEAQIALNPSQTPDANVQTTSAAPGANPSTGSKSTPAPSEVVEINNCDLALFVDDVTILDGTVFSPGDVFTKTWRLQNIGTCTWTTGYELVFFEGDSMGGLTSKQLTNISIYPGDMVDISVDLSAPATVGNYRGYWKLQNSNSEQFTFSNDFAFYVEIEVIALTATPGPKIESFTITTVEEGAVQADGYLFPAPNVGDTVEDLGLQAFFQFDISSIPLNAVIEEVLVSFVNFDILGNPFTNLGCLRGYNNIFFPLDSGDYMATTGSSMKWCDSDQLDTAAVDDEVKADLQTSLGSPFLEYRLQFNDTESNYDIRNDMVRFGTVSLRITYRIEP